VIRKKEMKKTEIKKAQQALARWQESHADVNSLRKAYRSKVLDWVVKSMEFEREPVSMDRLKELLKKEKTAPAR
jgi:uncharacterized protein YeaO (DUF488 family)